MAVVQFTGLVSGIDSKALIDAIIEAREAENATRRSEIEFLESESDALEELNTKLLALSELIDPFRTANGGGIRKKGTSSTSTVATAVVGSTAANASLGLTVTTVARAATGSIYHGAATYAATSDAFDPTATGTGSISILVGTGSNQVTVSVSNIDATTTVQNVVDAINSDSDASGRLVASAVNVGTSSSPNYKIVLAGQKSGTDLGTVATSLANLSASIAYDNSSPAANASFSISGINGTISRATNSVSDVVSGVTFQLLAAGSTTITIGEDADATQESLNEIVEAFNDIVEYITEHDEITREENSVGATNSYGSLAKTEVDDDFLRFFRDQMAGASSDTGTYVTALSELGLKTNRDGTITFDTKKFQESLGNDPTGASEVLTDFADGVGGITGTIYQFTKFQGFIDVAIDANNDEIGNLNDKIEQVERASAKIRDNLEGQFMRLESLMGKLQNMQSALTGVLAGLSQ